MSFEFSPEALAVLEDAGWFPERNRDTTEWAAFLDKMGHPLHEAAQIFLASFGGLKIRCPDCRTGTWRGPAVYVVLDPKQAIYGDEQDLTYWSRGLRQPLCLIGIDGYRDGDSMGTLVDGCEMLMSEDGRVWATWLRGLSLVGHSGAEWIEAQLTGTVTNGELPDDWIEPMED